MIEFKRNVEKILPYDREEYIDYLADAADLSVKWYGASFQVPEIAGALIFSTEDLEKYSKELVSYPFIVMGKNGVLYKNLDISHSELPAVVKISGHLNIDFLSIKEEIFRKIIAANFASSFVVKEYRGN